MRSVLPNREFLLDIALVGIACGVLTSGWFPVTPVFVASWRQSDGSVVRHRVEGLGQNPETIRLAVLAELTRSRSANVGIMRWQQETSRYYAETSAPPTQKFFRQVSHVSQPQDDNEANAWHAYWHDRANRSERWLHKRASAQTSLIASFNQSLAVSKIEPLFPNRQSVTWALATGLSAMLLGCLWRGLYPPRTLVRSSSTAIGLLKTTPETPNTEIALMSFRGTWVEVRQSAVVRLRQTCGWSIVVSAIVSMAVRLSS